MFELGFTVNVEKSQLVPVYEIMYLGFIINSIAMTLQFPKVTGLLIFAFPAVNYLEMHYRYF